MIKPPTLKLGRPKKEVLDPEGKPVPYLGSYDRKNKKGQVTKAVYYSYWLDADDLDSNDKPKRKKYYYKKPYPAVIIEHKQRMAELSGEKQELALGFYREHQAYLYASSQFEEYADSCSQPRNIFQRKRVSQGADLLNSLKLLINCMFLIIHVNPV